MRLTKSINLIAALAVTLSLSACDRNGPFLRTDKLSPGQPDNNPQKNKTTLIRHEYAPGELEALCQNAILKLTNDLKSAKNALEFEKSLADFSDTTAPLTFMGYVSTTAVSRDEASQCEENVSKTYTETFTRRDLYEIVKNSTASSADEARLISEHQRAFEVNGMALSDQDLEKFRELKTKLSSLETEFSKNLNSDVTKIEFSLEELDGVSKDFINSLEKSTNGKYLVKTKSTDYTEVIENAKLSQTRQKMLSAYENRAAEANKKIINEAVQLRAAIAKLLGKKTWAEYRIQGRMATSPEEASTLLNDLKVKLQPRLKSDLDTLLSAKIEMQDKDAKSLDAWDLRYFLYQVVKRDYTLDTEKIKEYFPKDTVMRGMFKIYSTLFNVTYHEVADANVWHPTVKLYEIRDKNTGATISYFYTDLEPRDFKYGHAAAFTIISGRKLDADSYSKPVSSIVANFTPATSDKPSLLTHDEVETLFHEFGHIMHQTLTRAPFASLSGSSTAQDFVEAPSQMLENWVWNAEMLKQISGHYKNSNEKLPAEIIEKMLASRNFGLGYTYMRQITFGLTDLKIHTDANAGEVNAVYRNMFQENFGIPTVENSHFMSTFGHMMGGYDAGYYGYIWSEVYAADMFTAFQKDGLLNEELGAKYRSSILEKGNMQSPLELITEFLGRTPNNEAFLKKLGL